MSTYFFDIVEIATFRAIVMADSPSWLWSDSLGLRGKEVCGSQLCVRAYADAVLTLPSDVCVSRRLRL